MPPQFIKYPILDKVIVAAEDPQIVPSQRQDPFCHTHYFYGRRLRLRSL